MSFFFFPKKGKASSPLGDSKSFYDTLERKIDVLDKGYPRVLIACISISLIAPRYLVPFKISTTRCKSWNRATPSGYDFNEFYSRSIFNFVIEQSMKFLPFLGRTLKITYMLGSSAKLIHNYKRILTWQENDVSFVRDIEVKIFLFF